MKKFCKNRNRDVLHKALLEGQENRFKHSDKALSHSHSMPAQDATSPNCPWSTAKSENTLSLRKLFVFQHVPQYGVPNQHFQ